LARGIAERGALFGDTRLVEYLLGVEHFPLGWFQNGVHAPDYAHGQDDVGILASLEEISQNIVGDAPYKGDDFVVRCLIHVSSEKCCAYMLSAI
jgi:hypothetical protein